MNIIITTVVPCKNEHVLYNCHLPETIVQLVCVCCVVAPGVDQIGEAHGSPVAS